MPPKLKCIFTTFNEEKSNKYWQNLKSTSDTHRLLCFFLFFSKIKLKIWIAAFSWIIFAMLSLYEHRTALRKFTWSIFLDNISFLSAIARLWLSVRKMVFILYEICIFLGRWSQCTMVMLVISLLLCLGFVCRCCFFWFLVLFFVKCFLLDSHFHMCARCTHKLFLFNSPKKITIVNNLIYVCW